MTLFIVKYVTYHSAIQLSQTDPVYTRLLKYVSDFPDRSDVIEGYIVWGLFVDDVYKIGHWAITVNKPLG